MNGGQRMLFPNNFVNALKVPVREPRSDFPLKNLMPFLWLRRLKVAFCCAMLHAGSRSFENRVSL